MNIDTVSRWLNAGASIAVIVGVVIAIVGASVAIRTLCYPLLSRSEGGKGGRFRDLEIEQYISVFEDIGYLVEGNLIIGKMAYNEFSYDLEKAWCNADVAARRD